MYSRLVMETMLGLRVGVGVCMKNILYGSLGAKLIIAKHWGSRWVWPPMEQYMILFILVQTFTPTPSMHQKLTKYGISLHAKQPNYD
jgi:hypothetical protein